MRAMGERARSEIGASAVEFAIVASVLFMIMFGTIQFGIAYNRYQGLQAGAREGARLGSIGGSYRDIFQRVKDSVATIDQVTHAPASPCTAGPGDPPTTTNWLCVNIYAVQSNGSLTLISNPGNNTVASPCAQAATINPSASAIDVQAKYKMDMAIPFVAGFSPVLTGEGRFRCES